MKNLSFFKLLAALLIVCCLVSAVIVVVLISRYERPEERVEFQTPVIPAPDTEKILPYVSGPGTAAAEATLKDAEPPEKEMPLKQGELLLQ
jgi:hypothetical protein